MKEYILNKDFIIFLTKLFTGFGDTILSKIYQKLMVKENFLSVIGVYGFHDIVLFQSVEEFEFAPYIDLHK